MKICSKCNQTKPKTEYQSNKPWGLRPDCKDCHAKTMAVYYLKNSDDLKLKNNNRSFIYKYGLSKDDVEDLKQKQNHMCSICEGVANLQVDHNHSNNRVRGLICPTCNRGLGMFKDTPSILRKAADYLERFE